MPFVRYAADPSVVYRPLIIDSGFIAAKLRRTFTVSSFVMAVILRRVFRGCDFEKFVRAGENCGPFPQRAVYGLQLATVYSGLENNTIYHLGCFFGISLIVHLMACC